MPLWVIRIFFLVLCITGGYAVSQVQPDLIHATSPRQNAILGMMIGFGFGGFLIAIDEMLKGFSLRAFSAATFGLFLGTMVALMLDRSELFQFVDEVRTRWLIRLSLFVAFGYIGMVLAMRSNKEDFSLIIPYVRFASQSRAENMILMDTSVIIDGRIADLIDGNFMEGIVVVPRFVLKELQQIADSADTIKKARGRRGLDMLKRIQQNPKNEIKIHEGDFPDEKEVDTKLIRLALALRATLYTNDYNLAKMAELQSIRCVNLKDLGNALKPVVLPGEIFNLKIVREGKDKGQGVGYLNDGTMVVVNQGQALIGQQAQVQVQSLLQTGAGIIIFAELKVAA